MRIPFGSWTNFLCSVHRAWSIGAAREIDGVASVVQTRARSPSPSLVLVMISPFGWDWSGDQAADQKRAKLFRAPVVEADVADEFFRVVERPKHDVPEGQVRIVARMH